MNTIIITTSQNIELEFEPGSLGDRIAGAIIDNLIIAGYSIVMFILFFWGSFRSANFRGGIFIIVLLALPVIFYDLASELLLNGQSAGKKVMGIKVISLSGGQPSLSQYLIRWIFRLIDFTVSFHVLGVILVAATEKKQRLGDLIAGTVLVKTKPRTQLIDLWYQPIDSVTYNAIYPEVIHLKDADIQLIKEVILSVKRSGNTMLLLQTQQKIEQVLHIQSRQPEPISFLQTVLSDYNYLTSLL